MAPTLETAPALSTPDLHIFEHVSPKAELTQRPRLSPEQLMITYDIRKTVQEIRATKWKRVALQFPDQMLPDAPQVFEALQESLLKQRGTDGPETESPSNLETPISHHNERETRFFILADTSYGACCVDEIAAEHADADVVVHYGRTCLSPTSRLPVIYVYTTQPLSRPEVIQGFKDTFPDRSAKVVLMADVTYSNHLDAIQTALDSAGYVNIFTPSIVHDPSSPIPNRTIPEGVQSGIESLSEYHLFHISDPPTSLLLSMSSRVASFHIYPTDRPAPKNSPAPFLSSSSMALRRRYALLTSLNTASIFGILINTLSVKNYLDMVELVKKQIAAAGKKSYTFVVGKVNAAKVANFGEIEGWVVIGCWESSLIESKDFWRPMITPFELSLALQRDEERIWTGEWDSTFDGILKNGEKQLAESLSKRDERSSLEELNYEDDSDSAPPEFDLRTGRYVSNTRPMKKSLRTGLKSEDAVQHPSQAISRRSRGDVATIGGELSPAAEYLRTQRTWKGLGSDFEIAYEDGESDQGKGIPVREGRSGIARGYNSEPPASKD